MEDVMRRQNMVFYAVLSAYFNKKELRKPRSPRAFGGLLNHV